MTILSKILNYESSIFEEYSSKRKNLIDNLKTLNIDTLDNSQLSIFTNDLKAIIDPIKTSISAIDHYFTNTDFKNNQSTLEQNDLGALFYLFLGLRLNSRSGSELALETETLSDSLESSVSLSELSDSSSKSSRSVSVTFSNTNFFE